MADVFVGVVADSEGEILSVEAADTWKGAIKAVQDSVLDILVENLEKKEVDYELEDIEANLQKTAAYELMTHTSERTSLTYGVGRTRLRKKSIQSED